MLLVWSILLVTLTVSSCHKQEYKPTVLVFAHAGMSLYEERAIYPANSFEAIRYSVDVLGAEGIEIDVQMTKDSVLVLFHDAYITTSPNYDGCVGNYNWEILKGLKLNNSAYKIIQLDTVMNFLADRKVKMYLDLKPYNFCERENKPFNIIANQLDSIMAGYSEDQKKLVIAGSLNVKLLVALNTIYKSIETVNVESAIRLAETHSFQYIMLPSRIVGDDEALRLSHTPFNWGVFGGKSNGEIRKTIRVNPTCFISDNFVYTQKITK